MRIYFYDKTTHEHIGVGDADPSPAEPGQFLVPGNATTIEPPQVKAGNAAVFNPATSTWSVVPDKRGTSYWMADGTEHTITEIGVAPPAGALDAAPPLPLDKIKAAQITTISGNCEKFIRAGFVSSALGVPHTYPANDRDQLNLARAVNAALRNQSTPGWKTPYWCAAASETWALRYHDAAQIQQADADGQAAIVRAQTRNAELAAAVNAATTEAEVTAIVWTDMW